MKIELNLDVNELDDLIERFKSFPSTDRLAVELSTEARDLRSKNEYLEAQLSRRSFDTQEERDLASRREELVSRMEIMLNQPFYSICGGMWSPTLVGWTKKIATIKLVRELFIVRGSETMGLKEAKDLVESCPHIFDSYRFSHERAQEMNVRFSEMGAVLVWKKVS